MGEVPFVREFAMPNRETFSVKPIGEFVKKYLRQSKVSVDPFARNNRWATWSNDFDMATAADNHMDAEIFLRQLAGKNVTADLVIFDPPYSPRQISEHYRAAGHEITQETTQSSALYRRVRNAVDPILEHGGIVLSFGWHSNGMGIGRGYKIEEVLLVAHGAAHNDTICIAERKSPPPSALTEGDR